MSVLVKGMSFPTKENFMTQLYLICDKDGDWYAVDTTNKDLYKLIEVKEPHGGLIDADKMIEEIYPFVTFGSVDYAELKRVLKTMNAVIEAEGIGE